ncbi:hypothetical protein [Thiolinea disciformis]|uniref:hypothetical protein n=1 Tax=Thiolinea disciformis TaxID=125614 RepID=UPI000368E81A|nr:hypothetical protein [Thiolinea disciformis]
MNIDSPSNPYKGTLTPNAAGCITPECVAGIRGKGYVETKEECMGRCKAGVGFVGSIGTVPIRAPAAAIAAGLGLTFGTDAFCENTVCSGKK